MLIQREAAAFMEGTLLGHLASVSLIEIIDMDSSRKELSGLTIPRRFRPHLFGSVLFWWNTVAAETCVGDSCLLQAGGRKGDENQGLVSPSRAAPGDLSLSSRPHLPKFLECH